MKRMLYIARGLSMAWALFWLAFGLQSSLNGGGNAIEILFNTLIPGGLFFCCALIAWKYHTQGGILLLLVGAIALFFFTVPWFVKLLLVVPPMLSAYIFLRYVQLERSSRMKVD